MLFLGTFFTSQVKQANIMKTKFATAISCHATWNTLKLNVGGGQSEMGQGKGNGGNRGKQAVNL